MAREISKIFLALNLVVFCITAMPRHIEKRLEQKRDGKAGITARDALKYLADNLHIVAVAGKSKKDQIEAFVQKFAEQAQEEAEDEEDHGENDPFYIPAGQKCRIQ